MAYEDFEDLPGRTASDKVPFDKAQYLKYYGYQRSLDWMVYNLFDKKSAGKDRILKPIFGVQI